MTNKYLKITNKTNLVPRVNLEKLGLSTKRNDPGTIGQFGSGIKFAPIAAMRNGWEWWFTGSDQRGQYKMKYTKAIEDGIECIVYDYGDYQKSSSFTVDAGVLSWVNAFQIYREAVSNALDEAGGDDSKWYIDIVDEFQIHPVDGEFSVYITAAPELIDIHNNFDKYFATDRKRVGKSRDVSILEKIDSKLRVYCHNVLVFCSDEFTSVFDYNIDTLSLNEERTISSTFDFEWKLSEALVSLDDEDLARKIILADNSDPFELIRMSQSSYKYTTPRISWYNAFVSIHGDNSVLYNPESSVHGVYDAIKLRGYNPVLINNSNLYQLLSECGVKNYINILGEQVNLKMNYNYKDYKNLDRAITISSYFIPEIREIAESARLGVFDSDEHLFGITMNLDKLKSERVIGINSSHVNDAVENIVATLVHEYDHWDTSIKDNDYRHFRELADRRIAKLMMSNYTEKVIDVVDGELRIEPEDIGYFGSPISCFATRIEEIYTIVKIGKRSFAINHDSIIGNKISISISECGSYFYVSGVSNITYLKEINVQ